MNWLNRSAVQSDTGSTAASISRDCGKLCPSIARVAPPRICAMIGCGVPRRSEQAEHLLRDKVRNAGLDCGRYFERDRQTRRIGVARADAACRCGEIRAPGWS